MYHLIADSERNFIVVDDISYRSSDWEPGIPLTLDTTGLHWDQNSNIGKPITEALGRHVLLASSPTINFHLKYKPSDFPELLL